MSMYRTVTITPKIVGSIIAVQPVLKPMHITFSVDLSTRVKTYTADVERYQGEYDVEPSFTEKTLKTKDKLLLDDVTVNPIRVERMSNAAGGITVYIGGI